MTQPWNSLVAALATVPGLAAARWLAEALDRILITSSMEGGPSDAPEPARVKAPATACA